MYTRIIYRVVKSNKQRFLSLFMANLLLLIFLTMPVSVFGQTKSSMTDIRVGLKSLYTEIESIKINNSQIGLGYCIDERYICDTEFFSNTGFVFRPVRGYYYSIDKTYQSYKAAKKVADTMKTLNVDAYPVAVYRNYWKVYIGGTTDISHFNDIYKKIERRFSFTYTKLSNDNRHRIIVTGQNEYFLIDGEVKNAYPQIKALTANNNNDLILDLGSRQYRGRIEIGRYGKDKVSAVNIINIESYLFGVVPAEMPGNWPNEALKAQALCARSFALSKVSYSADSSISRAYYIDDTTNSQVYKGYNSETANTTNAVNSTRGEVVTYKGDIIPAYFFSTSGGSTENSSDVWGKSSPYLKRTADSYETEPEKEPWIIKMTKSELASRFNVNGKNVGSIDNVITQLTTGSGRVYLLKIIGTKSSIIINTASIREALGFPSTKFKVIKYGDIPDQVYVSSASQTVQVNISESYVLSSSGIKKADTELEQYIVKGSDNSVNYPKKAPENAETYYFAGMGYGHGVGMSQSGAKGMANAGYSYYDIIRYYYQGCEISNIN